MRRSVGAVLAAWVILGPAASRVSAQVRWETFLHGGQAYCVEAEGDTVWVGTSAGIRLWEVHGDTVRPRELAARDGLPGHRITALHRLGRNLWVGTADGVVGRLDLDTSQWTVFDRGSGLPAAQITRFVDDGQELWLASAGGGVARFNPLRQEWELWGADRGLPSAKVWALAADTFGLWAATDQGLARYLREKLEWQRVTGPKDRLDGPLTDLLVTPASLWIVGEKDGLSRIPFASGELLTYDLAELFKVQRVDCLLRAPTGDIWIATDNGLLQAPAEGEGDWKFHGHPAWHAAGLAWSGNSVWAATAEGDVWRYRTDADAWEPFRLREALPSADVTAVAPQANLTWVGFGDRGLADYDLLTGAWQTIEAGQNVPKQVRDVAAMGNLVYCACADGIAVYDQRGKFWTSYLSQYEDGLLSDEWTSVLATGDRVYFAGPGRVSMFTPDMALLQTFQLADVQGRGAAGLPRLVADEWSGDVWVITAAAAWRYRPRQNVWSQLEGSLFAPRNAGAFQREGRLIRDVAADNDAVWFVTLDRVAQYRKQPNEIVQWSDDWDSGLRGPRCVAVDRFSVWVAAEGALCRFQRETGDWQCYDWPAELAGEPPTALAVDGEERYVWVATAHATARLELAEEGWTFNAFPPRTGVVGGVRRIVSTPHGVWFVGDGGVSLYRRGGNL